MRNQVNTSGLLVGAAAAGIAAGVSGLAALVGLAVLLLAVPRLPELEGPVKVGLAGCALGVPVGAIVAWRNADRALDPGEVRWPLAVRLGVTAVLIGAFIVAVSFDAALDARMPAGSADVVGLASGLASGVLVVAGLVPVVMLTGLVLFGIPATGLAIAVAWVWIQLLRRAVGVRAAHALPSIAAAQRSYRPRLVPRTSDSGTPWIGRGIVAFLGVFAALEVSRRVEQSESVGILYVALVGWTLVMITPTIFAGLGVWRRSPIVMAATAVALVGLAAVSGPAEAGGYGIAAAALMGVAIVRRRARPTATQWLLGATGAILLLGGQLGLVSTTETVCWDQYPDFGRIMRILPDEPNGPSELPILSSACLTHSFSAVGGLIAIVTSCAAAAVLARSAGIRRPAFAFLGAPRRGIDAFRALASPGRTNAPRDATTR